MPAREETRHRFVKRQFAEQYSHLEQWHWWFRGRQRILAALLRCELAGRRSLSIASLGCGPAEGLTWLKPMAGPHGRVVGLDADPLHARRLEPSLEYVIGRCEAVPFATGSFDLVLALDVLEHLDDDAAGLREAVRLLKPDGFLLVTVPALPSLWGRQDIISQHRRRYTKRTLRQAFARAQLPHPRIRYFNSLLFLQVAAVRWVRSALGLSYRPRSDFDNNHPGLMNEILEKVFSIERHLVYRVPMPVGVSLLATVRLGENESAPRD